MTDRRAGDNPHTQAEWDFVSETLEEQILTATLALQRAEKAEAALRSWMTYDATLRTISGAMLVSGDMPDVDAMYDACVVATAAALAEVGA